MDRPGSRMRIIVLLCMLMWGCNEVVCTANSRAMLEEPNYVQGRIPVRMPGTRPAQKDTYLCTAVKLQPESQYIVQFEPNASQETVHHMLLFGCALPGGHSFSWNCGRGNLGECKGFQKILFAWAKDAPAKDLPKDVGIQIGGESGIMYLVLQVHYATVDSFKEGGKDYSGFILHTRKHSLPFGGGIYLLWAGKGSIPPDTGAIHVDVACEYRKEEPMFAFAYRCHAHRLATVITGYRIRDGVWTLLGKGDPQAPQAFYQMEKTFEIKKGDILVARCTYDSRGHGLKNIVHMGSSSYDEMCNFYMMYYSNANRLKYSGGNCGQQDHPGIFKNFPIDSDVSLVHSPSLTNGTDQMLNPVTEPGRVKPTKGNVHFPVSLEVKKLEGKKLTSLETDKEIRLSQWHGTDSSKKEVSSMQLSTAPSSLGKDQAVPADSFPTPTTMLKGENIEISESQKEEKTTYTIQTTSAVKAPSTQASTQRDPSIGFDVVSDWPSFTTVEMSKLGQATGVSMDSKSQLIVFHRGSRVWDERNGLYDKILIMKELIKNSIGPLQDSVTWYKSPPYWMAKECKFSITKQLAPVGLPQQRTVKLDWCKLLCHGNFTFLCNPTWRTESCKGPIHLENCLPYNKSTFDESGVFRDADTVGTIKEHTVWIIDSVTGKVRGVWGKSMFYLPHGLTIDHEDNLWVTDVGSHQVFKFSPLGSQTQQLLVLGEKLVPGADGSHFCKPTSVAVDKTGDCFVADGYCNSRIMKFSAKGRLLMKWGEQSNVQAGLTPAPGTFLIPHSLALNHTSHTLYVADRENGRVQAFNSSSGVFLDEIKLPQFGSRVFAVDLSNTKYGGLLHVVNGPSSQYQTKNVSIQMFTVRLADKVIVNSWPTGYGQVLFQPHDIVSTFDGSQVYVGEIGPNRLWKLCSRELSGARSGSPLTSGQIITQAKQDTRNDSSHQNVNYSSKDPLNSSQNQASSTEDKAGSNTHALIQAVEDPSTSRFTNINATTASQSKLKNSTINGAENDALDNGEAGDLTAAIIPALVILSVLAVPIVFLLLISISLRVRAYRRDKQRNMSGLHGSKRDVSVGTTRGWLSYMNCCDRQKYKFNRVTLHDFYSDSDSDGV